VTRDLGQLKIKMHVDGVVIHRTHCWPNLKTMVQSGQLACRSRANRLGVGSDSVSSAVNRSSERMLIVDWSFE
jgi:hypothetical protein